MLLPRVELTAKTNIKLFNLLNAGGIYVEEGLSEPLFHFTFSSGS